MRIQCLWAGQTLSCVCILIYTSAEKGSGNNKRKNRTNQDELVPSFVEPGKRCGCSCCCSRYYCLRPRAVVIAVFAIFMPGQSRSPHTTHTAHTRTPHTITLTLTPKHAKHQGLCAMQIPHGFSIFSNHFHGSPLPGHLSGHYAASRALIKQITVVRPRILALIETLLRARTRLVFGVLVSWCPGGQDVCAAFCCQLVLVFQLSPRLIDPPTGHWH